MTRAQPNLTLDERNRIAQFLIANNRNGSVQKGKVKEVAQTFGVCRTTVHNIWVAAKNQISQGLPVQVADKMTGIPKIKHVHLDIERMKRIAFQKRGTIRRHATELEVSKSTVGRWVKEGVILHHLNAIKPAITEKNKFDKLNFSLNALVHDSLNDNMIKFSTMQNIVHIDEKWFYMTREIERSYKAPGEEDPYRACKSKRFIPKVIFMCAVSRPIFASDGQVIFDGKIGLFPFTIKVPAARNSKNRVRGTMVTKPIDSINKQVTRDCIVNQATQLSPFNSQNLDNCQKNIIIQLCACIKSPKQEIIPAIKAKWPINASKDIIIQQDNATPHISNSDPEFKAAASSDGFNIILVCQPANSPDCNINDLDFFNAIQSLQVDTDSYNVNELLTNVLLAFKNLTAITLNNVFLSLQCCLIEMMKTNEHNQFKLTHMGKERLIREQRLPLVLEVEEGLVRECISYLIDQGQIEGLTYDIRGLMTALGFE